MAYNLETVLDEKFETIITRGLTNTRMRDFYDVYILTATRSQDIDMQVFVNALESTVEKRNTSGQMADAMSVIAIRSITVRCGCSAN